MEKKLNNKIKYIKPRQTQNNKPLGGFKCPKLLIAVTETGVWFLHTWFNVQAYEDASEIGWGEYQARPFEGNVYKLDDDTLVEFDLDKITCESWDTVVGRDCKQVGRYPLEGRYTDIREEFERIATRDRK